MIRPEGSATGAAAGRPWRRVPWETMMRGALFAALLGSSALIAISAALAQTSPPQPPASAEQPAAQAPAAQPAAPASPAPAAQSAPAPAAAQTASGPADLCKELVAYAERKAAEPPKPAPGQPAAPAQAQAPAQPAPQTGS